MLKMQDVLALPIEAAAKDACIIDEDHPDYVMLAIRVPRSLIANNHDLLGALSERATGAPAKPARRGPMVLPPIPAISRKAPVLASLALAAAILLPGILWTAGGLVAKATPPVEYGGFSATKSAFKPDEDITIGVIFKRNRQCRTEFERSIINADTREWMFTTKVYGGISPVTDGHWRDYKFKVRPDRPLKPGHYLYTGWTYSDCTDGGRFDLRHDEVTFSVVE